MTQSQKKLVKHNRTTFCDSEESDQELSNGHDNTATKNTRNMAIQTVAPNFVPRSQRINNLLQERAIDVADKYRSARINPPETSRQRSPAGSRSRSTSPRNNGAKRNGIRREFNNSSESESQESQLEPRCYRTGHYEVNEQVDMINFLIENHRVSSCCSFLTWQIMGRERSDRNPHSLHFNFTRVIAPNIAQYLQHMGKINEPQLLKKFREALAEENITETNHSAELSASVPPTTPSSPSVSSKEEASTSIQRQEQSTSKESRSTSSPVSPKRSDVSCESLNGTIILDSEEEETDSKDPRLINVPLLFNSGASKRRKVVEEEASSTIKEMSPVTRDINIKTENPNEPVDAKQTLNVIPKREPEHEAGDIKIKAEEPNEPVDATQTLNVILKREPEYEEDNDVMFIEALDVKDKECLVKVEISSQSDESDSEATTTTPAIKRRNYDEDYYQVQSPAKKRRTKINGESDSSYRPRIKQGKIDDDSTVSINLERSSVEIKQEKSDVEDPDDPIESKAEISIRIKEEKRNEDEQPVVPAMSEDRHSPRIKQEKNSNDEDQVVPRNSKTPDTPKIEENIMEVFPDESINFEERNSMSIKQEILEDSRVIVPQDPLEGQTIPTGLKRERKSIKSVPKSLRRLDFKESSEPSRRTVHFNDQENNETLPAITESPKRFGKIRVIAEARLSRLMEEPVASTSAGLPGHGFQASEYNHLAKADDSDSDSDGGFIRTQKPPNLSIVPVALGSSPSSQLISTVPKNKNGELNRKKRVQQRVREDTKKNKAKEPAKTRSPKAFDSMDSEDDETQFPRVTKTSRNNLRELNSKRNTKTKENGEINRNEKVQPIEENSQRTRVKKAARSPEICDPAELEDELESSSRTKKTTSKNPNVNPKNRKGNKNEEINKDETVQQRIEEKTQQTGAKEPVARSPEIFDPADSEDELESSSKIKKTTGNNPRQINPEKNTKMNENVGIIENEIVQQRTEGKTQRTEMKKPDARSPEIFNPVDLEGERASSSKVKKTTSNNPRQMNPEKNTKINENVGIIENEIVQQRIEGNTQRTEAKKPDAPSPEIVVLTDSDDEFPEVPKTQKIATRENPIKEPEKKGDEADSDDDSEVVDSGKKIWERMYGPITVGQRKSAKRIKFEPDFHTTRVKAPPQREFSRELLDALRRELQNEMKPETKALLIDLALLHYFVCRPNDIQSYGGRKVFRKILDENWEILQGKSVEGLRSRFNNYIRGYLDKFGLPKPILDEFLYWEWQRYQNEKKKDR